MSLLRYCGGKVKQAKNIVPHIKVQAGGVFCEPFVGGGSVALAVAEREMKIRKRSYNPGAPLRIVLNDRNPGVAAFWSIISGEDWASYRAFVTRVIDAEPSVTLFKSLKASQPTTQGDLAYKFFLLNRMCFMPSNGKRPLGGWTQPRGGIDDRCNMESLIDQMHAAREILIGRTSVFALDFSKVIAAAESDWTLYLDPPYYAAGSELYTEFTMEDEKHIELRDMLRETPADWVLSYDKHTRIAELYTEDFADVHPLEVQYSMHARKATEALIFPRKK
jgi:DNA adenine methylase